MMGEALKKALVSFVLSSFLLSEVLSQNITTVTYVNASTNITCPIQGNYIFPSWTGPLLNGTTILYTLEKSPNFNPDIGLKKDRLKYAYNNRTLILTDVIQNDAGIYFCTLNNSKIIAYNTLQVRVRPQDPEITASIAVVDSLIRPTQGQTLTVTCTSRGGYPEPTVVWYNVNTTKELANTTTGIKRGDTYTVTLNYTFTVTRQLDRNQLACRSYFPSPADSQDLRQTHIALYLYLKPREPSISLNASVATGNDVTVECRSTGSRPAADITWEFRGQTITSAVSVSEDLSTETFEVESVLQTRVTAADNGQIVQCKVTHFAGVLTKSSTLNVLFPVSPLTTEITGNKVIAATGTNQLNLTCTTGPSNPASSITWMNGSGVIDSSNPYDEMKGQYNGTVRSQVLTLIPKRTDDGETITCSVTNRVSGGSDRANVTLNLNYSPMIISIPDMEVTEGNRTTLKCTADSKPPANFSWVKGSVTLDKGHGTGSYNGFNYTISNVNRSHAGTYNCIADNQIPPPVSFETILRVLYPPDITVIAINTTFSENLTTVTCNASGVPDTYTYEGWVHTWNGKEVSHPVPLPNTRVLTFNDLTYANSGVYTCLASNGVKGVSQGSGSLLVESFPILVGDVAKTKKIKTTGQIMRSTAVIFQYYSNVGKSSVQVFRTNGTSEAEVEVHQKDVYVTLPVFESKITTPGTEAVINVTLTEENEFGAYEIQLTNKVGSVTMALIISPLGPPDPPFDVNITVLDHKSVDVTWTSGFPNGLNQTFVIQYSTDNRTWLNVTTYGGMSYRQIHTMRIDALASSQVYYVRMLSTNVKGESKPTDILSFKTTEQSSIDDGSSIGLIVGSLGGTLAAVVIVAVVFFMIWSRKRKSLSGKPKDKGALVESSNENPGFDDRDEVINKLYESAGPSQSESPQAISTSKMASVSPSEPDIYAKVNKKSTVVYAVPNKPNDLYAFPDKTKEKKVKKNLRQEPTKTANEEKKKKGKKDKGNHASGDVYENAPSNMYTKSSMAPTGTSVYEDTNIDAAQVPQKPPRADGLVYAELEFKSPSKGKDKNKIIGLEDRCEYTTIDLTKKAKPLPDGEEE